MLKQKSSKFILLLFCIGLLTSSIHSMENENHKSDNIAIFDECPELSTLVQKKIKQAQETKCFKELLDLKEHKKIAGTPYEHQINQTIVELMDGIYPISSLVDQSLRESAHFFNALVKTNQWEKIKERLTSLPEELRIKLINLPVNQEAQETLLHLYTQQENNAVVKELLELGADANLRNYTNSLPLTLALAKGNNELIQFLRQHTTSPYSDSRQYNYGLLDEQSLKALKLSPSQTVEALRQAWACNNVKVIPYLLGQCNNCISSYCSIFAESPHGYRIFPFIHNNKKLKADLLIHALYNVNMVLIKQLILDGIPLPSNSYGNIFRKETTSSPTLYELMNLLWNAGLSYPQPNQRFLGVLGHNNSIIHYAMLHAGGRGIVSFLNEKDYQFDLFIVSQLRHSPAATSFEYALINSDVFFINFIINQAKKQGIDLSQLIDADRLLSANRTLFAPDIYHIFLNSFLSIITDPNLIEKEKISCIQALANLAVLKEAKEGFSYKAMCDTFISLCNFHDETINLTCTQALNFAFLCKDIKFLNLVFDNLKRQQIKLETIADKDTLKNLFLRSFLLIPQAEKQRIIDILKFYYNNLSPIEFENLCNGSFDKEDHKSFFACLIFLPYDYSVNSSDDFIVGLVSTILNLCPQLKTKKDYFNQTPLEYIMRHKKWEKWCNNEKLIALLK